MQIDVVEDLVAPKKLTGEMKKTTARIRVHFANARNLLNRLEIYINKAKKENLPITIAPADFGIKAIRDQIQLRNDEGVVKGLRDLQKCLNENLAVLTLKGYSTTVQAELDTLFKNLSDDSIAQTKQKKDREKLVQDNMAELNDLWDIIGDVLKSGKTIFQEKGKLKVKDYTFSSVIKDVHLKRKQEEKKPETNEKTDEKEDEQAKEN